MNRGTVTKAEGLKPCPFCGGTDLSLVEMSSCGCVPDTDAVKCNTCDAQGPIWNGTDEKVLWDTRGGGRPPGGSARYVK